MSDGLTVPFALAAGLSGRVADHGIIVTAGLAEVAAGSIAMGLGGYLAARSDAEHYRQREAPRGARGRRRCPTSRSAEVAEVFRRYGLNAERDRADPASLSQQPPAWVDFMMRFELGLEEPDPRRALSQRA